MDGKDMNPQMMHEGLMPGFLHQPMLAQQVMHPGPMILPIHTQMPMHASSAKDIMDRGQFVCAHCHTTHVTSQLGRGGSSRRKSGAPPKEPTKNRKPRAARPRSAVIDGQKVLLCNACGIYWQRKGQKRPLKPVKRTSARKKPKIIVSKEDSPFYHAVANAFSIQEADLLWCDCSQQCTSKYLLPDPTNPDSLNREECAQLVEIHKKALYLKKIKSFPKDDKAPPQVPVQEQGYPQPMGGQYIMTMVPQQQQVVPQPGPPMGEDEKQFRGYARGHVSSKEYERYVFTHIESCKAKKLCGKFRKKLLSFSNDWLYKRPTLRTTITTGPDGEKLQTKIEVVKGKPRVMQEKKFEHSPEELKTATCCNKLCCQKIWTNQIAQWRKEYVEGNNDQRWNVIQQMLLGEGYGSSKCVNVVRMITGCSRNLVASVSNYLQQNQSTGRPPSAAVKQELQDRADRQRRQEEHQQQQHHAHHAHAHHAQMEAMKNGPMQLPPPQMVQHPLGMPMYAQSPQFNGLPNPLSQPMMPNLVTATITVPSVGPNQGPHGVYYVQQPK